MKSIRSSFIFLSSLFLVSLSTLRTQAQEQSYYKLEIKNTAPKELKFINKSKLDLKLILYKGSDNTMLIGLKTLKIKAGKSDSYQNGIYNVKIFKSQLIDKHLTTKKNVSGNLQMSGTENKFSAVRLTARRNTEFKNNAGMKIKICLYNKNDMVKAIPFATYTLEDNTSSAIYSGDKTSFFVSVFEPGVIDRLLVSQICPYQSTITVKKVE